MSEEIINVPLEPQDKAALKQQAADNGRAMMREAATLIKKGLRKRSPQRTATK